MIQANSNQSFGQYLDDIPPSNEYLTLNFSPDSAPRNRRWKNYGLSADFLGDYFAAFFPGDETSNSKINRRDTVKAAVSYIANELLENAVKYSDESNNLPISITLHLYEQDLIFHVINYSDPETVGNYQRFIEALVAADPDEFYAQQLERTAMGESESSSMGLLTMINDYGASFGWKFQSVESQDNTIQVSVMARLVV